MFSGWEKPDPHDKCVAKSCKYSKKRSSDKYCVNQMRWVYNLSNFPDIIGAGVEMEGIAMKVLVPTQKQQTVAKTFCIDCYTHN